MIGGIAQCIGGIDSDTNTSVESDSGSDSDSETEPDTSEDYPPVSINPLNLIDDFEDGDASIIPQHGRFWMWYMYNDDSLGGTQMPNGDFVPEAGGPLDSSYCAHTYGGGFTEWGTGMGVNIRD